AKANSGIEGIARGVSALAARRYRLPIARRDLGELAARAHRDRTRVLLRGCDPVRKAIVDGEVVQLRRWLIEPRAPCHGAWVIGFGIVRDDGALIAGHDHRVRVVGIDPGLVVVVATG